MTRYFVLMRRDGQRNALACAVDAESPRAAKNLAQDNNPGCLAVSAREAPSCFDFPVSAIETKWHQIPHMPTDPFEETRALLAVAQDVLAEVSHLANESVNDNWRDRCSDLILRLNDQANALGEGDQRLSSPEQQVLRDMLGSATVASHTRFFAECCQRAGIEDAIETAALRDKLDGIFNHTSRGVGS